ncbi:hypothetical protein AB0892_25505 [Streptomyces sp. NPDC005409]|uniref:hypothetical protein n=1 Tax=Streptomyces sp. NPDC005409 TaxID=3155342 RepID=UPI003456F9C9
MRTALRASLATAVLAGALLAPAAGAAYAATSTLTATAAPQSAPVAPETDPDRFTGTPVYIGEGLVAVLRNQAEGPEAWIRAVGPDWKPGDHYMFRVLATLSRMNLTQTVNGLELELVKGNTTAPVLTVTEDGATRSFPLPVAGGGGDQGAACVSGTVRLSLGGGLLGDLRTTPDGPEVQLVDGATGNAYKQLTRTSPALEKGDRTGARIVNPHSAEPQLRYDTPGGQSPVETARFPVLPEGCRFTYTFKDEVPAAQPTAEPTAEPTASTSAPKAQTAGQTAVVPRGGVAAGAELPAEDRDDTTTALAGTGLVAIFAGLGAALLLRRRPGAQR